METRRFFIAGVQHHNLKDCINCLETGDYLVLTPEPTNKYDPNAVRIEYLTDGAEELVMLGYVPRKFSSEIAGLLEVETPLSCVIVTLNKSAKPWEMCEVVIEEVEEDKEPDLDSEEPEED